MGSVVIHAEPGIEWQGKFAPKMQAGLKALGIDAPISNVRRRMSDVSILLGTTLWRGIEADGRFLLVDRASFGDPDFVQLVWDGHGRRGDHRVPENTGDRWDRLSKDFPIRPWDFTGNRTVLCGQTETYSPHYATPEEWYKTVKATHFRKHPAGSNPTGLPRASDWTDCTLAVTLNSSVAVDAVMNGIPAVTMDAGAMAWPVASHYANIAAVTDRGPWLEWLAWTQWHHDEIRDGEPIRHLFEDAL